MPAELKFRSRKTSETFRGSRHDEITRRSRPWLCEPPAPTSRRVEPLIDGTRISRPAPTRRPCRLLLVNDDAPVIEAIHMGLAAVPYRLAVGPTALAAAPGLTVQKCTAFDLVFVDMASGVDGLALLIALQRSCLDLPVIALVPTDDWARKNKLSQRAFLTSAAALRGRWQR